MLWKPLKRLQNSQDNKQINSDFAELSFTLEQDLPSVQPLYYQYSGIQWQLKSEKPLKKGDKVNVVKKDVGVMWVESHNPTA